MDFKAGLYDSSGSGITASSDLDIRIKRDADDFFFDFNDTTFKNAGWTTIDGAMTDIDVTNVPGEYEITVDVSGFDDGVYTVYYVFTGTPAWTSAGEFRLTDGISAEDVNAQMVDVMNTDTQSLPGQGAPTVTPTIKEAIMYWYKQFRNRETQTDDDYDLYADDGTTKDQHADVSDDGTTFEKGEMGTGA